MGGDRLGGAQGGRGLLGRALVGGVGGTVGHLDGEAGDPLDLADPGDDDGVATARQERLLGEAVALGKLAGRLEDHRGAVVDLTDDAAGIGRAGVGDPVADLPAVPDKAGAAGAFHDHLNGPGGAGRGEGAGSPAGRHGVADSVVVLTAAWAGLVVGASRMVVLVGVGCPAWSARTLTSSQTSRVISTPAAKAPISLALGRIEVSRSRLTASSRRWSSCCRRPSRRRSRTR